MSQPWLRHLARGLKRASREVPEILSDLVHEAAEDELETALVRLNSTKQSPRGVRWDPWSEGYAKTRGPGHSLLIDSGAMRDSFWISGLTESRGVIYVVQETVANMAEYAGFHDEGIDGRMPQREFLGLEQGADRVLEQRMNARLNALLESL